MSTRKGLIILVTSTLFFVTAPLLYGQVINQPANMDNLLDKSESAGASPTSPTSKSPTSQAPATAAEPKSSTSGSNATTTTDASSTNSSTATSATSTAFPTAATDSKPEATKESIISDTESTTEGDNAATFNPTAIVTLKPADEKDTATLEKLVKDWTTAFNKRDLTATCALFAKNLVADYRGLPQKNYSTVCNGFKKIFADKTQRYEYKYKIHNVYRINDLAVIRITWYLHTYRDDKEISVIQDEGMDVLTKNDKDQWKIVHYIAYQK